MTRKNTGCDPLSAFGSHRSNVIVFPQLSTALDTEVFCATARLVKLTENVSVPDEGDLKTTEPNSDFRLLGSSVSAVAPSFVPGRESDITTKHFKKHFASGNWPCIWKMLASATGKIKLRAPFHLPALLREHSLPRVRLFRLVTHEGDVLCIVPRTYPAFVRCGC